MKKFQKQKDLEAAREAREQAEREAEEELRREKEGYNAGPRVPRKSKFVSCFTLLFWNSLIYFARL